MEFGILGPLEVATGDGPVRLDAPKQRALLAVLIIHANEVVSSDRLLDLAWGESDSDGQLGKLRFQISKLRGVLEPGRDSDGVIVTRPHRFRRDGCGFVQPTQCVVSWRAGRVAPRRQLFSFPAMIWKSRSPRLSGSPSGWDRLSRISSEIALM